MRHAEQVVEMPVPIGTLVLSARHDRLTGITIVASPVELQPASPASAVPEAAGDAPVLGEATAQLGRYFAGQLRSFRLPLDLSGLPPFTRRVLELLQAVPFGATVTYGELAARAGAPGAARAVGRAMAANPLPIVIPCHRVIAADGSPGGYSGGSGVRTKVWLLAFERDNRRLC